MKSSHQQADAPRHHQQTAGVDRLGGRHRPADLGD
jgi:hypothetical protein